jgi:hypothetical protein
MANSTITLHPRRVALILATLAVAVVAMSIVSQLAWQLTGNVGLRGIAHFLNVSEERNLPTAFAVMLLAIATLLLAAVFLMESRRGGEMLRYWVVLTCGFLWMTADEAMSFHERVMRPMRRLLGNEDLGLFYYAWVVPALALVAVLGAFFAKFLLRLPSPTGRRFLIAGTLFLSGAIGLELFGGRFDEKYGVNELMAAGETGLIMIQYSALATVEESLEMAGIIFFIWSLLWYLANEDAELIVRFRRVP